LTPAIVGCGAVNSSIECTSARRLTTSSPESVMRVAGVIASAPVTPVSSDSPPRAKNALACAARSGPSTVVMASAR
jgi:hypothetical protein